MSANETIRQIVREEIRTALRAMRIEAESYDGGEIKNYAADAVSSLLEGTLSSLRDCWGPKGHTFASMWGEARSECRLCGTPAPDPFKEDGRG